MSDWATAGCSLSLDRNVAVTEQLLQLEGRLLSSAVTPQKAVAEQCYYI
jgi:hypothetical protein